jgi:pimeloyl-ACP methyl ester carboxylesterase
VISARTFLERLTNAPDLVENAKEITCPVLFIRGNHEPVENYPAERVQRKLKPGPARYRSFPTATIFIAEDGVSKIVTDWLKKTIG